MSNSATHSFGLGWAQQRVRDFHIQGHHPAPELPTILTSDRVIPRANWMREEIDEFEAAESLVDQADAIIDLIYFALGSLVEMGVDSETLFDIVHRANMRKLANRATVRADGKIQKPADWVSPESEIAASIVKSNSGIPLIAAKDDASWIAIREMIASTVGPTKNGSPTKDSHLLGRPLDLGIEEWFDDFIPWSKIDEADFHRILDESLAIVPFVVVGYQAEALYGENRQWLGFGIVLRRSGNHVLIIDPGPDSPGLKNVNIDDLHVGMKLALDGLHQLRFRHQ